MTTVKGYGFTLKGFQSQDHKAEVIVNGKDGELSDEDLDSVSGGVKATATPKKSTYDAFLRLDGIDGESSDDRHKGEIQLDSY